MGERVNKNYICGLFPVVFPTDFFALVRHTLTEAEAQTVAGREFNEIFTNANQISRGFSNKNSMNLISFYLHVLISFLFGFVLLCFALDHCVDRSSFAFLNNLMRVSPNFA